MLLGSLGWSLLENMLAGRGINRAGYGSKDLQSKGDGMIRAGYGWSENNNVILSHPLMEFILEIIYVIK